jgi:hypothetical protein
VLERKQVFHRFWTIVSLLVILNVGTFDLVIITAEDSLQVQYTPDDAYYYLTLAKNFSKSGLWTFDSGHTVTSGFHPLNVVNLDGLANNEVYDYAISNSLPSYVSSKGIRYIIDFEDVFLSEKRRLRGGYDDWEFINSLRVIRVFDDGEYRWKHLTLYEFVSQPF